jgi:hypothetical protein
MRYHVDTRTAPLPATPWLRALLLLALLFGLTMLSASRVSADTGTVTVTATSIAKFSLSLSSTSVVFGATLSPDGTGATGSVASYPDGTHGAYFVQNGTASTYAVAATVASNKAWSGSVSATENLSGSGITITGGGLRWLLNDMGSLAQAQGGSAFALTPDTAVWDAASSCTTGGATKVKGVCTYNFDYSIRVRWIDDPGAFSSTLTYLAAQT